MKFRRTLCNILILLFCTIVSAQTKEPSGAQLCSQVHYFLKKNGFSPYSQNLIASGENIFPYNIIVTFSAEQNSTPENLLLVFFQEDVLKNQEIIKNTLKSIQEEHYPFTITALFAYGEKHKLEKNDMIYGTRVFLESLSSNLSYTAVIFDLESRENSIQTTAAGLSSPPQLIKYAFNLYQANGMGKNLPVFILSQLSSYNFISSRILSGFFEAEIPAIELSMGDLADEIKTDTAEKVICGFVKLFSRSSDSSWDHHFMIIKLFQSYHIISERFILKTVVPVIFLWLMFIFILIFVNRRMKRHTWSTIGKIWWSVPLTYLIMVLVFLVSGFLFRTMFQNSSYAAKIYGQLIVQIILSLLFTLSFYLLILTWNYNFNERAIDYLLVISCFINQSVFIMADISLSPIFIIICLLSLLALTVKNNYLHIAVFLLMIVPLIPYTHRMIDYADLKMLSAYLSQSKGIVIVIPLVLYPVYIVLFRIFTSIRSSSKKFKSVIISTCSAFVIISFSLIILGLVRTASLNKEQVQQKEIAVSPLGNELITISVSNQNVFDDIIRTVDVSLKKKCLLCDILITSEDVNPVLYSENDYTNPSASTARFRLPDNPPQEMTFKYGAAKGPSKITVSAVIESEEGGDYQFISHSIETGDD